MTREPIKLYQVRKFGDKINITFSYVSQNFKSLFLSIIYISGPFLLIAAIMFYEFFDWYVSMIFSSELTGAQPDFSEELLLDSIGLLIGFFIIMIIVGNLLVTIVYSHMMIYKDKNGSHEISVKEVWDRVKKEFWSVFVMMLGIGLFATILFAILGGVLILPFAIGENIGMMILGIFLLYVGIFYVSTVLSLAFIIRINEKTSVITTISRCFKLIRGKFWSTFGLLFVVRLISQMMSYVFIIPLYFVMFIGILEAVDQQNMEAFEQSIGSQIFSLFGTALFTFGSYVVFSLPLIAIAFQYFSLVEMKEATGLMADIDSIGKTDDVDEEEHY